MARQSKALRGKFRWLGLRIDRGDLSRGSTSKIIAENLPDIDFKLFDSISSESDTLAIIRLKLEYNDYAREKLATNTIIDTLTTSGKIRLVRQRLGLSGTGSLKAYSRTNQYDITDIDNFSFTF